MHCLSAQDRAAVDEVQGARDLVCPGRKAGEPPKGGPLWSQKLQASAFLTVTPGTFLFLSAASP